MNSQLETDWSHEIDLGMCQSHLAHTIYGQIIKVKQMQIVQISMEHLNSSGMGIIGV